MPPPRPKPQPDRGQQPARAAQAAADPQSKPQVPQAAPSRSVGDLIARVEKEYQSGQDNYRDGHLEAAKQNFDSAFNQLLGSGFDLRSTSDDRLERELDRILDGINGLELAACSRATALPSKSRNRRHRRSQRGFHPVDANIKAKAKPKSNPRIPTCPWR